MQILRLPERLARGVDRSRRRSSSGGSARSSRTRSTTVVSKTGPRRRSPPTRWASSISDIYRHARSRATAGRVRARKEELERAIDERARARSRASRSASRQPIELRVQRADRGRALGRGDQDLRRRPGRAPAQGRRGRRGGVGGSRARRTFKAEQVTGLPVLQSSSSRDAHRALRHQRRRRAERRRGAGRRRGRRRSSRASGASRSSCASPRRTGATRRRSATLLVERPGRRARAAGVTGRGSRRSRGRPRSATRTARRLIIVEANVRGRDIGRLRRRRRGAVRATRS